MIPYFAEIVEIRPDGGDRVISVRAALVETPEEVIGTLTAHVQPDQTSLGSGVEVNINLPEQLQSYEGVYRIVILHALVSAVCNVMPLQKRHDLLEMTDFA
ncbi:MAG: hypothetical protein UT11_C0058G0005 [Berkelbacteria bacterium GW2011_GWA2_38_9]|uniref:Uncharacterized protein n=1 Tax=Berkelbacteria bacterium GW2011_GWA2_38_9 TaxID=1618334 RepID=A0A0G0NM65_9BACT|nr:MAG: hypothetical protein UT11_C0058G0005 [Berkelbacteria bacterium GW2011_GWA2_38_9]